MTPVICWLRRDLRLVDNAALYQALQTGQPMIVLFIFDPAILKSNRMAAVRVKFMLAALEALDAELRDYGGRLLVRHGKPVEAFPGIVEETGATQVFFNRDYTPFARKRDGEVEAVLQSAGVDVVSVHDRLLVTPEMIESNSGKPYSVYTPFKNKWREIINEDPPHPLDYRLSGENLFDLTKVDTPDVPTLTELGFEETSVPIPPADSKSALKRLREFMAQKVYDYKERRNIIASPGDPRLGTSFMSPYIRFGLVSLRQVREASADAYRETSSQMKRDNVVGYMNEIVWHEFYTHVLWHFPHVKTEDFNPKYKAVKFRYPDETLEAWKAGMTGFPIVDAAMRQMDAVGWMHNRARMIVASFMTKDLLLYWTEGELYFMQRLMDGDLAQNNGGWQWAAGTGTDAQPYFRIFNPVSQSKKFDPDGTFIREWLPELRDVPEKYIHEPHLMSTPPKNYPKPIVDHKEARQRVLEAFSVVKGVK
jgi:deoxyribodipyrimidine photo-lyase